MFDGTVTFQILYTQNSNLQLALDPSLTVNNYLSTLGDTVTYGDSVYEIISGISLSTTATENDSITIGDHSVEYRNIMELLNRRVTVNTRNFNFTSSSDEYFVDDTVL